MRLVIKIKKSCIVLGSEMAEALRRFDLSGATPLDCMDFLRKLKELDGNKQAPRL